MRDTIKGFRGKDGPILLDYSGVANVPGAIQSIGALTAQPGAHFEVESVDSTGRVATVKAVEKPGGGAGQNANQYEFLSGLKYYACGDSIVDMQGTLTDPETFGDTGYSKDLQNRDISGMTVEGYVSAIERRYGLVATNYGRGGETLVAGYRRLAVLDYSDVALVTIAYGVNDARSGVPLGDVNSADISTFAGAMNNLLRKIYTDNPECRVVILTPIQRLYVSDFGIGTPNANGHYLIDFCRMCEKVAAKRSTACINMYEVCGINQTNLYYYTVEGVHPVNQGFARMTNAIIPVLDGLFSVPYEPFGTMTNTGDTEPEEPDTGGSGSEPPPEEEPEGTVVDMTGLFTVEGMDMDGWGTGKNATQYQTARYTPVPGKTYTIITYASLGTTDFRGFGNTFGYFRDDGSIAGNRNGSAVTASEGSVTVNGVEVEKIKTVFTVSTTWPETQWVNIACLDTCIDAVEVSYI